MEHSEVIHRNWFQRIIDALKGFPLGIMYIIVATWALIYGEKNHAKTTNLLKYSQERVQPTNSKTIDPAFNDKLVLLSDSIVTKEELKDSLYGVKGKFLKLFREVKVYQWKETITKKSVEDNFGGKTDSITYSYNKVWNETIIDSRKFKYAHLYKNPQTWEYQSAEYSPKHLHIGAFNLNIDIVEELNKYSPVNPSQHSSGNKLAIASDTFRCLGVEVASNAAIYSDYMVNGEFVFKGKGTPLKPEIGDYKFVFWAVEPAVYSIVAQQRHDTIRPLDIQDGFAMSELNCGTNFNYQTNKFQLILAGVKSKEEMYHWAHDGNDYLFVIGLRLWGFLFMVAGFRKVFLALAVIPAWVPVVGKYLGKAVLRFSFLCATSATFLVSGTTWLIYNNFDNITKWDYYFLILVGLIFLGGIRVVASTGGHSVDSTEVFDT